MDGILHGFIIQALLTVASFAVGYFWNKSKALSERQQAMEKGTRALLKIELRRVHRESKSALSERNCPDKLRKLRF